MKKTEEIKVTSVGTPNYDFACKFLGGVIARKLINEAHSQAPGEIGGSELSVDQHSMEKALEYFDNPPDNNGVDY